MMAKRLSSLHPVDEEAERLLRNLGTGEIVSVEIHRPRNVQFHRRFFAMLKIILDNQSFYKSMDDLLDVTKLSIGHCRTVQTKGGSVKIPSSISFAAMDEVAFEDFYDRAVVWVCEEVIPGLERRTLDEEVKAALLGFGESA
mgnify:CR=1 FL=1